MQGEPYEGTFKTEAGDWRKVEYRFYPTKRLVVRNMNMTGNGLAYADDLTPDLTPEIWAGLREWLK